MVCKLGTFSFSLYSPPLLFLSFCACVYVHTSPCMCGHGDQRATLNVLVSAPPTPFRGRVSRWQGADKDLKSAG